MKIFLLLALTALASNEVSFTVSLVPAGSFVARTSSLSAKLKGEPGKDWAAEEIVLPLTSLKTGIDLRDAHLAQKYFEVEKYPSAKLTKALGKNGALSGELNVHGVTKPVTGTYEWKGKQIVARFNCRPSDFGIPAIKYMGVGVEDEVEVKATVEFP